MRARAGSAVVLATVLLLTACDDPDPPDAAPPGPGATATAMPPASDGSSSDDSTSSDGSTDQDAAAPPAAAPTPPPAAPPAPAPSATPLPDPRSTALLSIPSIGVTDLPVVPYDGTPDDAPGTDIQNGGLAASPRGPGGGVAPGEVGNYVVTGHRVSAGAVFEDLPMVRDGDLMFVSVGETVFTYVVTGTLEVSFRSEASKALQVAPVPGSPGVPPVHPMITISTCATPEDRAAGNTWTDQFGNPEHRIAKYGILESSLPD